MTDSLDTLLRAILVSDPFRPLWTASRCRGLAGPVLLLHAIDRIRYLAHVPLGLLDRRVTVAFPLPSIYVALELVVLSLLLLDVLAKLADVRFLEGIVDELQSTRFTGPVFFGTLLSEVAPTPEAASPSSLVKVAHAVLPYGVGRQSKTIERRLYGANIRQAW